VLLHGFTTAERERERERKSENGKKKKVKRERERRGEGRKTVHEYVCGRPTRARACIYGSEETVVFVRNGKKNISQFA